MRVHLLMFVCWMTVYWWMCAGWLLFVDKSSYFRPPHISPGLVTLARNVHWELRPFYLSALGGYVLCTALTGSVNFWTAVEFVWYGLVWHWFKDIGGDDDRWRRRRKKLVEKVALVNGRLTVSPA